MIISEFYPNQQYSIMQFVSAWWRIVQWVPPNNTHLILSTSELAETDPLPSYRAVFCKPVLLNEQAWTLCIANVFLAWKSTIHTELYGFSGTWLSKIDLSLPCACTHTETSSGSYLWDKLSRRCQHGCCESTGLQSFHPKGRYGKPV